MTMGRKKISTPPLSKRQRNLDILYVVGFLLSLAVAIPTYVESNYLQEFVNLRWVSLFFVAANLLTFTAILFYPALIKRFRNFVLAKVALGLLFLGTAGLVFTTGPIDTFIFFLALSVGGTLIFINLDIWVEKFSLDSRTGRTRTTYYTFLNLAWVVSPLIASFLINDSHYRPIFLIAAFFLIPVYLIFVSDRSNLRDHIVYAEVEIVPTTKEIWQTRDLRGIFFLDLLLRLFYALAVVYVPIYLHQDLGFSWSVLGVMFAFMLLPFIFFEIPAGILADKHGEKEIMVVGFTIMIMALLLFGFVDSHNPWLWGAILFFSRIGASLVEAMREAYFFKKVSVRNVGLINFFRTTGPLGTLFGTLLGAIILRFYQANYIFILLAVLMVASYYFIYSIQDTK